MLKTEIEHYLKNIENFCTERVFTQQYNLPTPHKKFFDYFYAHYLDPRSKKQASHMIQIPDYDKKIFYLFKHFPYPDLIKIIIKHLKFLQFQEQITLQQVTQELYTKIEGHLLEKTLEDLVELTSEFTYTNQVQIDLNLVTGAYHILF